LRNFVLKCQNVGPLGTPKTFGNCKMSQNLLTYISVSKENIAMKIANDYSKLTLTNCTVYGVAANRG